MKKTERRGNHFQSGSTSSAAKYTEKSLMGRKQTELLFSLLVYGFITGAHTERKTQNVNTTSFLQLEMRSG